MDEWTKWMNELCDVQFAGIQTIGLCVASDIGRAVRMDGCAELF